MCYRSCDVFGSPEEVQVDRHASRLVEGEGEPKLSTPCLPPRSHQPRRLLHQDPSRLPPHSRPSLPSRHPLPPSINLHTPAPTPTPPQPTHHPPDPVVGSPPTTGTHLPFHHLSLHPRTSLYNLFFIYSLALPFTICCPTLHFKQGTRRTRPPQPHQRSVGSPLTVLFCLCLRYLLDFLFALAFFPPVG